MNMYIYIYIPFKYESKEIKAIVFQIKHWGKLSGAERNIT
jgi:hypothetical protein